MREHSIRGGGLNTLRLLQVLAAVTIVFLLVLASAPVRPYFAEWRRVQQQYNRAAVAAGVAPTTVEVKQIWKPALGITDRCVTCHLGMAAAPPLSGHTLFGAHPSIPHDPREYGCSLCHGGQGRATSKDAAHGFVSHWDEQMLDRRHLGAGCGSCHDKFPAASQRVLAAGGRLIEQLDCLSCHRVDGRGHGSGPDLTLVGLQGFDAEWHAKHLEKHEAAARTGDPAWRSSYGPIAVADLKTLDQFLRTRVGAPRVVEARALAASRGCLGCHKLGGLGGDEGPALDAVGRKPIGELNFAHVAGPQTFTNYLRQHFIDPAGVFPGSTMLTQSYTDAEIDLLVEWVLSLRARALPVRYLPKDRVRRQMLGEPRERMSPEEVFGAYCAACHGPSGEGRTVGNSEARFPAIGSRDFLALASDDFILSTVRTGRPGRRMPALAAPGGPLDETDVRGIVAWLRSRQPAPPADAELTSLRAAATVGRTDDGARIYARACVGCHGAAGEGRVGPALANAAFRQAASIEYIAATVLLGRSGTPMPSFAIDSVSYPRLTAADALDVAAYVRTTLGSTGTQGER
jgi:mono/diheme cytochrome c family protein